MENLKIILDIIIGILLIIAVSLIILRVIGFTPFTVTSNSMYPELEENTVIFIRQINFDKLKVNDIITFTNSNNDAVTHRIVAIDTEKKQVITKGDNNQYIDVKEVNSENILGKYYFKIPYSNVIINKAKSIVKGRGK